MAVVRVVVVETKMPVVVVVEVFGVVVDSTVVVVDVEDVAVDVVVVGG